MGSRKDTHTHTHTHKRISQNFAQADALHHCFWPQSTHILFQHYDPQSFFSSLHFHDRTRPQETKARRKDMLFFLSWVTEMEAMSLSSLQKRAIFAGISSKHSHAQGRILSFFFFPQETRANERIFCGNSLCLPFFCFHAASPYVPPAGAACNKKHTVCSKKNQAARTRMCTHTHARTHAHGWAKKYMGQNCVDSRRKASKNVIPFANAGKFGGQKVCKMRPAHQATGRLNDAMPKHGMQQRAARGEGSGPIFHGIPAANDGQACVPRGQTGAGPPWPPVRCAATWVFFGGCDKESQGTHVSWLISRAYAGDTGHARICASV